MVRLYSIGNYNAKASFKRHYDFVWPGADGYIKMYRQAVLMVNMVNRGEMSPNQLHRNEFCMFDDTLINCPEILLGCFVLYYW